MPDELVRSEHPNDILFNVYQRSDTTIIERKQARLNIGFFTNKASLSNFYFDKNIYQYDITDDSTTDVVFNPESDEAKVVLTEGTEYHIWITSAAIIPNVPSLTKLHYRIYTGNNKLTPWVQVKNGSSVNSRVDWKASDLTDGLLHVEFDTPLQNGSFVFLRIDGTAMNHNFMEES